MGLLELFATPRLCSSVPYNVSSVLVEKKNVQFDVITQKGKLQTVLHLHVSKEKCSEMTTLWAPETLTDVLRG